jgi:hypothetical protein
METSRSSNCLKVVYPWAVDPVSLEFRIILLAALSNYGTIRNIIWLESSCAARCITLITTRHIFAVGIRLSIVKREVLTHCFNILQVFLKFPTVSGAPRNRAFSPAGRSLHKNHAVAETARVL